jgi:hypothetical protein
MAPTSPGSGTGYTPPAKIWFSLSQDCEGVSPYAIYDTADAAGSSGATQMASSIKTRVVCLGSRRIPTVTLSCSPGSPDFEAEIYLDRQLWWEGEYSCRANSGAQGRLKAPVFAPTDIGEHVFEVIVRKLDRDEEEFKVAYHDSLHVDVILGDLWPVRINFYPGEYWSGELPAPPCTVTAGTSVQITATYTSRGNFRDYDVVIERDGVVIAEQPDSIWQDCNPWVSQTYRFEPETAWVAKEAGEYRFSYVLDPEQKTRESDRSNNVLSRVLTVVP